MQFVTNLFLLALRLKTTSGLKVIDSGIGLAEYGAEEKIGDYAVLASDQKASLPTQVHGLGLGCRTKCSQNAGIVMIGLVGQLTTSPPLSGKARILGTFGPATQALY